MLISMKIESVVCHEYDVNIYFCTQGPRLPVASHGSTVINQNLEAFSVASRAALMAFFLDALGKYSNKIDTLRGSVLLFCF